MLHRPTLYLIAFLAHAATTASHGAFYFVDQKIDRQGGMGLTAGGASLTGLVEIPNGTHVIATSGVNPFTTIDLLLTVNGKSAQLDSFMAVPSPYAFFTLTATESELVLDMSRSTPWPTVAALQFYSGPGNPSGIQGSYTIGSTWDWRSLQRNSSFGFMLDDSLSVGTGSVRGPWRIGEAVSAVPEPSTYLAGIGALGVLMVSFLRGKKS